MIAAPCCYCDETIEFRAPAFNEPFGAVGRPAYWLHPSTGGGYAGACHCIERAQALHPSGAVAPELLTSPHPYSHDRHGKLICPTWRDDHIAAPLRS